MKGRDFLNGKALSDDLRNLLISDIKELGGNAETGSLPRGTLTKLSDKFRISISSVSRIWQKFCSDGEVSPRAHGGGRKRKLDDGDVVFIESCVREKPSISQKELIDKFKQYSPAVNVSKKNISDALHKFMPSGREFTFKKVSRFAGQRFTDANMEYTQTYIDFISQQNPNKIKFFDESGFKLSDGNRNYRYSEVNTTAVEISRFIPGANLTLNLMVSLAGLSYYNFVEGSSNAHTFINFWTEASESYAEYGQPCIEPGYIIIVDNCSIHKHEAGRELEKFFERMGVTYFFLPTYSPDLNPTEKCFSKIKTLLKQDKYQTMLINNLKVAIGNAVSEISASDLREYYRITSCIQI